MMCIYILSCLLVLNWLTDTFADFHVFTSKEKYSTARNKCEINNKRLAKVDDQIKYDDVVNAIQSHNSDFWIGLRLDENRLPDYKYIYEDNTTATFLPWDPTTDEPNLQDSDKCIRINHGSSLGFRTTSCSLTKPFVCEDIYTGEESTTEKKIQETSSSPSTTTTPALTTLLSSGNTEPNLHGSASSNVCDCLCSKDSNNNNASTDSEELAEKINEIKANLYVDKRTLSLQQRKLISANDDRQSSAIMGYLGVIFISLTIFLTVSGDIMHVLSWMIQKCSKSNS